MDTLLQDLRVAWRSLLRSPGFTAIAVLCLALGIGLNSAVYSTLNGTVIRPLPFADSDRLVGLSSTYTKQGYLDHNMSYPDFHDIRAEARVFDGLFAHFDRNFNLSGGSEPEWVQGEAVSHDAFDILGVKPILGRGFTAEEGTPGGPKVVMLGHGLWQRRFAADPQIVGRTVRLNGEEYVVVGVMPPRFAFPETAGLWVPIQLDPLVEERGRHYLGAVGRLKPGISLDAADADVRRVAVSLAERFPDSNFDKGADVEPLRDEWLPGEVELVLWTMLGAVGFVLLIACANVANLLLARASARQREIAIRVALGAGRWRIVRQLLTESVLLGLAGGAVGILLAVWGVDLLWSRMPEFLPYWITFEMDRAVLVYTLVVSLATGFIFGLAPALEATRTSVQESLKDGSRGAGGSLRRNRLRSALVVAEIALSLVLLVGASLMVRTFFNLRSADPGFDPSRLLAVRLYLTPSEYRSVDERLAFWDRALERVRAVPGVEMAAATNYLPLSGSSTTSGISIEGRTFERGERPSTDVRTVTSDYFRTLGIPAYAGREFTDAELRDSTARVVVVSRAFAERFWPGESAIGKRVSFGSDSSAQWLTIVGVVPDVKIQSVDEKTRLQMYQPYAASAWWTMSLLVRTSGAPEQAIPAVRRAVKEVAPELPLYNVTTMSAMVQQSFWERRLFGEMFGTFGVFALLLAAIGVYGVMAYSVAQRTHEIGVRVALGARPGAVVRLVVRQGLTVAAIGLGVGLLGALALTRVLGSLLVGVSTTDPVSYGVIALVLASVAALASFLPARRASRTDPLVALRYE